MSRRPSPPMRGYKPQQKPAAPPPPWQSFWFKTGAGIALFGVVNLVGYYAGFTNRKLANLSPDAAWTASLVLLLIGGAIMGWIALGRRRKLGLILLGSTAAVVGIAFVGLVLYAGVRAERRADQFREEQFDQMREEMRQVEQSAQREMNGLFNELNEAAQRVAPRSQVDPFDLSTLPSTRWAFHFNGLDRDGWNTLNDRVSDLFSEGVFEGHTGRRRGDVGAFAFVTDDPQPLIDAFADYGTPTIDREQRLVTYSAPTE